MRGAIAEIVDTESHAAWNNFHDERYWARMERSHGDKIRMLAELGDVRGKCILEVGFGDGALLRFLDKAGAEVYGLDMNSHAIQSTSEERFFSRVFVGSDADIPTVFDGVQFDAIIACSVVHEIYSYGRGMDSVNDFLHVSHQHLVPGGILLIRDMVEPDNGDIPVFLDLAAEWSARAEEYVKLQPFGDRYHLLQEGNRWHGSLRAATAMLYTINWGLGSLHREAFELNQFATVSGYRDMLSVAGFDVETHAYFQESYRKHLVGNAWLRNADSNATIAYPETNIVVKSIKRKG